MNNFYIIANKVKDKGLEKTKAIKQFLELRGKKCDYSGIERVFEDENEESRIVSKIKDDVDAIISLGGDGTLIQISDIAGRKGIPILGVNIGNLGYLCEVEKDKVFEALEKLINDEFEIESRMMLSGQTTLASVKMATVHALNDVVIARRGTLGTLDFKVSVNGRVLYTCSSDGMIIATPTGSTGYNISAGGPIVAPYSESIILTPICAHSLNVRPIVFSADDEVEIELLGESSKPNTSVEVAFDGNKACPMSAGDKVTIRKAYTETKIIKLNSGSFFEVLSRKMSDR
ncbi:MAG: NAD(+)/NADH kinase [Lachnospiraceae bacterium]|nr:NAD(+)/NADH kinase [Lachnospiraceae bacterium]